MIIKKKNNENSPFHCLVREFLSVSDICHNTWLYPNLDPFSMSREVRINTAAYILICHKRKQKIVSGKIDMTCTRGVKNTFSGIGLTS